MVGDWGAGCKCRHRIVSCIVGDRFNKTVQCGIARKSQDAKDNVGLARRHQLDTSVMALPARYGQLRARIASAVGQISAGQLVAGIGAQLIEVVGIAIDNGKPALT